MKVKLPDGVSSVQDLKTVIVEVREYARWFSHTDIKKQLSLKQVSAAPVMSETTTALLREWDSKQALSQKSLDELIATLNGLVKNAPSLTITLAAPPTSDLKKTLVAWCRQNITPNILVTFQFNATLLGGMVVRYGSHIFDWSFRQQILTARSRFPEVLRSVR